MLGIVEREVLRKFGERVVAELKRNVREKRVTRFGAVNSSGKLHDSIRYELHAEGLRVMAADYIYQIEHGRKSGKFPPKAAIEEWVRAKPVVSDISFDSLVFLIRRKIAREGTTIFQQGGSDLVSSVVNKSLIDEINAELGSSEVQQIVSFILDSANFENISATV
jgi:hypothetical protein